MILPDHNRECKCGIPCRGQFQNGEKDGCVCAWRDDPEGCCYNHVGQLERWIKQMYGYK